MIYLYGATLATLLITLPSIASAIRLGARTTDDLISAIRDGDVARVESLLGETPSLAVERNDKGVSPPLLALYYGKNEIADLLLARKDAMEPLDVFEAAAFGRTERLKDLLDQEPRLANEYASDGFFPLGLAAFYRHEDAVRILLDRGAEPNLAARNAMNVAAIHAAAASQSLAIVRLLIDAGADVNQRQESGFAPLHEAAATGQLELVRLLLDHGADRSATTADGRTALDMAKKENHRDIEQLLISRDPQD
jgi:uncharacterized protein